MPNILHVQTVLLQETVEKLKEKSHRQATKDALTIAVEHYMSCNLDPKSVRAALQAAKKFLESMSQEMEEVGEWEQESCDAVIKQIDKALEER